MTTPRDNLIRFAAAEMRRHGITADEALNLVVDGCHFLPRGTLGRAMYEYFMGCSDAAHGRLIATVTRMAGGK